MDRLIFLDTETTGSDTTKDRLCQVAFREGEETRAEYFRPPFPITVKAMSIHHITNETVEHCPAFQGSQMQLDIQARLNEGIMVAHNARFDKAMLETEGVTVPRYICTYRVAHMLDRNDRIPEYNLQYLRYFLKLNVSGAAHDAAGDVNVLYALLQRLLAKVIDEQQTDEQTALQYLTGISVSPLLLRKFHFGKYRGRMISEIAASDRKYLEWLLDQKKENASGEEDWFYTLTEYLRK